MNKEPLLLKELESKPDFDLCMKRIYAWYEGEILDRPPVRFHGHNTEFELVDSTPRRWGSLKERWFDAVFQLDIFESQLDSSPMLGETLPVFWPNLGPDFYASLFGVRLEFRETTSWSQHILDNLDAVANLSIDWDCEYLKAIDRITDEALSRCDGRYLVGYTDLHPGVDCAAALRGTEKLCMDLYDEPEAAKRLFQIAIRDFRQVYDHFDTRLKAHGQPSVSWMHVPSLGRMHIPSADFAALISPDLFREFCLPIHEQETADMDHNVFHIDGPGVARHIDSLLDLDKIQAYQWVQGPGTDYPIMQWVDLITRIRERGKSVIVEVPLEDLDAFMDHFEPEGLFLWVHTDDIEEQRLILQRLENWTRS